MFDSLNDAKIYLNQYACNTTLLSTATQTVEQQKGQTCKLQAISHCSETYTRLSQLFRPIPVRKSQKPGSLISLRRIAKQQGSVVGEVYGPSKIQQLCKINQMDGTEVFAHDDVAKFCETVMQLIDQNTPAIVFFDIRTCQPSAGTIAYMQGEFEHAAAVMGYATIGDEPYFLVAQWGKYWLHSAVAIAT